MLDILKEVCSHLNLSSFTFDILGIEVPDIFSRLQYKFTPTNSPKKIPPPILLQIPAIQNLCCVTCEFLDTSLPSFLVVMYDIKKRSS